MKCNSPQCRYASCFIVVNVTVVAKQHLQHSMQHIFFGPLGRMLHCCPLDMQHSSVSSSNRHCCSRCLASVPLSGQCASTALRLPIVPEGTSKAASLPMILAAYSCSLLTAGSSPYTSSPTSACQGRQSCSVKGDKVVRLHHRRPDSFTKTIMAHLKSSPAHCVGRFRYSVAPKVK